MSIIVNGVDMVEIRRLEVIEPAIKARFLTRVYTQRELQDCAGKDARLAARFAAKEAAAKALGSGIGVVGWQDLETVTTEDGRPELVLHGAALRLAKIQGWTSWSLSLSHTKDYALACVTALADSPPK